MARQFDAGGRYAGLARFASRAGAWGRGVWVHGYQTLNGALAIGGDGAGVRLFLKNAECGARCAGIDFSDNDHIGHCFPLWRRLTAENYARIAAEFKGSLGWCCMLSLHGFDNIPSPIGSDIVFLRPPRRALSTVYGAGNRGRFWYRGATVQNSIRIERAADGRIRVLVGPKIKFYLSEDTAAVLGKALVRVAVNDPPRLLVQPETGRYAASMTPLAGR